MGDQHHVSHLPASWAASLSSTRVRCGFVSWRQCICASTCSPLFSSTGTPPARQTARNETTQPVLFTPPTATRVPAPIPCSARTAARLTAFSYASANVTASRASNGSGAAIGVLRSCFCPHFGMFSLINRGKEYGVFRQLRPTKRTHVLPHPQVTAVDIHTLSLERRAGVGQLPVALVHAEERLRGSEQRDRRPERCGWTEERPSRSEGCVQHVR